MCICLSHVIVVVVVVVITNIIAKHTYTYIL